MILCKSWTTQASLCPRQTHPETKPMKRAQCHPLSHACPSPPRVTSRKKSINKKAASQELCWTALARSVLLFITPLISLVASQCKGSDKKGMWMESFVNIQEIMSRNHNKFLRNENSELQSQVNQKATCQGRNKGSWCHVHGNYSICKFCWRAELTIKRIQQCKPSLLVKWRKYVLPKTI